MRIDLKTFLLTGKFGPISLHQTRNEVQAQLGEPDGWGPQRDRTKADIWKYGSMEFYFSQPSNMLHTIFSDWLEPMEGGRDFEIDAWIINSHLELSAAIAALEQEHIPFMQQTRLEESQVELRLPSGVSLLFQIDDSAETCLLASLSCQASTTRLAQSS